MQPHGVRCVACCMLWRVQVIGVARTCSLILIVLDCAKPMVRKRVIEAALTPWIPCCVGYHAGLGALPCYWLLTPLPLVHCCMEARAVASVPLWPPVGQPSSLCRHSEPRRRPLPAGTRVLVQRPVAKPEHNGKRARAVVRRAHRPVCGRAGRREGAVAQGRVRGKDGVRVGGMRVGGGEQRVRAALPPPRVLSVLSVAVLCAVALRSDAASRLGRAGLPRERCERARPSVLATTCRSAGAAGVAGLAQVPSDKAAKRARKEAKKAKNAGKADVE